MIEIDRVEFLENLRDPAALGFVTDEDRQGGPASAQIRGVPVAIVLWKAQLSAAA